MQTIPVLTVPEFSTFHQNGAYESGTFQIETVEAARSRDGVEVWPHRGPLEPRWVCHNPGASHQVTVWAFGDSPPSAHAALVQLLAEHPAPVRLCEGGDFRDWRVCQDEWEDSW